MVDVDYGDGVLLVERKQGLVEGAASANAGEFVVVGEHVGSLDQRRSQDQSSSGYVGVRHLADRTELEPQENGSCGPGESRLDRLARLNKTPDEHGDGGDKAQQNPERDRERTRMKQVDRAIFRSAQHGEHDRFEEEQSKARRNSGDAQSAFAHLGERDEVQRDQQGGERYGSASRSGENVSSWKRSSLNRSTGVESDGAMREQQN